LHPKTLELIQKVASLVEVSGIEAWYQLEPAELLGNDAEEFVKLTDVLDVWFDSGVSHFAVLESYPGLHFPADLYLEGSDQYRGWFQTALLSSMAMQGVPPYKATLTHGFTVDEAGHKMSKSLGNTIEPEKVWSTLGADIIRLWIAGTDYTAEMTVSDQILTRTSDLYRRIRNTARFLLSNLNGFDPTTDQVAFENLLKLDHWVVDYAARLQQELIQDYEQYQFHKVVQKIHHFCAAELGGFYLDIVKDRQYTCQRDSLARRSAQTAMFLVLEALVRWLAPVLSFTADEIWQHMPGDRLESVHLETWFTGLSLMGPEDSFNGSYWSKVMEVRDLVNKEIENQRKNDAIGSALEAEVTLYAEGELLKILQALGNELRFVLITSSATVLPLKKSVPAAVKTEFEHLEILIKKSAAAKCARCWHRCADLGSDDKHPELCQRCIKNIEGDGEQRLFA